MKKLFVFILLALISGSVFAFDYIEVYLRASPSIGGCELLLYSGMDTKKLMDIINKGEVVSDIGKWPKSALIEGEYVIKYYVNGVINKQYFISLDVGVYDPEKNVMIFCDIINHLRASFIGYLVINKTNINNMKSENSTKSIILSNLSIGLDIEAVKSFFKINNLTFEIKNKAEIKIAELDLVIGEKDTVISSVYYSDKNLSIIPKII